MMTIRETNLSDLDTIMDIHFAAFGQAAEGELSLQLLDDVTAQPVLSLFACIEDKTVGHIIFSKAQLEGLNAFLLAPLAVLPKFQKKGAGRLLIEAGLARLRESGADLVFVLGDPQYYTRFGFQTGAGALGYLAPHPLPKAYEEAWMVRALKGGVLGMHSGMVGVAEAIAPFEYWSD